MTKKFRKARRRFGVCLLASLVASILLSAVASIAQSAGGLEPPGRAYLPPVTVRETGNPPLPSPAPIKPKAVPLRPGSSFLPQRIPLPESPSGAAISTQTQPMGLLVEGSTAGRTIYVHDNLNRLIRAAYPNGTNISYSYDGVGNRKNRRAVLVGVPCDFDNDRKADIGVYRASTGSWYIYPSGGGTPYGVGWGGDASDKPAPGDYDGDGKADLAFYRANAGDWYIIPSGGGSPYTLTWGMAGDKPVPGDYDGDGKTDLAVYRPSDGNWYIVPSGGGTPYAIGWGGDASDKLVPGDYDGDGKTDVAIYRDGDGGWYIIPSSGGAPYGFAWGIVDDKPVPGDYDGDKMTDVAVYRAGTDVWYISPSSGAPAYAVGWGGDASDIPLTANLSSIY